MSFYHAWDNYIILYAIAIIGLLIASVNHFFILRKAELNANRIWLKFPVRFLYITCFLIALLGPNPIKVSNPNQGEESRYTILLLDNSTSMYVDDIGEKRIDWAKRFIKSYNATNSNSFTSLIVYEGLAQILVPFTSDQAMIDQVLDGVVMNLSDYRGSNLLDAITKTKFMMARTEIEQANIVILSDGIDGILLAKVNENIRRLKSDGSRVFFIGIGTEQGGIIQNVKDDEGLPVVHSVSHNSLKNIPASYIAFNELNFDFFIKRLITTKNRDREKVAVLQPSNDYIYYLIIAIVLLIIDVLTTRSLIR